MDDALGVRVVDGSGEAGHDRDRLPPGDGTGGDALPERPPLEVLKDDEELAAPGVLSHVMAHDDSGVREVGRHARFGEEATLEILALALPHGESELDRLHGHRAAEHGVEGLVDDAHHPAPQLALNQVAIGSAQGRRRGRVLVGVGHCRAGSKPRAQV